MISLGYVLQGEFSACLCVPQLPAVNNGDSCAFLHPAHDKKDQMQRNGDRVRIALAQDKQRRLELCLRLVLACHQFKTDHARNADRIQQKKLKNNRYILQI